jgi:hypothetical protein
LTAAAWPAKHERVRHVGLVLVSLLAAAPARAWNDLGHMEVAAVAFSKLTPRTKQRAAALLKLNPRYAAWIVGAAKGDEDRVAFRRAATWADAIKSDPAYKDDARGAPTAAQNVGYGDRTRHKYWHYVDRPFSPDGTPVAPLETPNVATQIRALRGALAAADTTDDVKSYDLVWLLHLVGDVHQPLHCISRFDRAHPRSDFGGKDVSITGNRQGPPCDDPRYCPFGPPTNLHYFWDDLEGQSYATQAALAAAAKLPRPDPKKAAIRDEEIWIDEGFDLAKTVVYAAPIGVGAGPFTIDEHYEAAARRAARERMALAGARLANLLNDALGK